MTETAESGVRRVWRRVVAAYYRLLKICLVMSVAVLIIPVSLQIFSRYTHWLPHYIWTEELARFLFIWSVMIGAMIGIRDASHFEVDIWPTMSARREAAVRLFAHIGVLVFCLVFLLAGIEFTQFAWNRISELAELPLWVIHVAWPICGVTGILFLGEPMFDNLRLLMRGTR